MLRKLIKTFFGLYDIDDLQIDALCGICGKSHKEVVEKSWPYALCRKCVMLNHDFMAEFNNGSEAL